MQNSQYPGDLYDDNFEYEDQTMVNLGGGMVVPLIELLDDEDDFVFPDDDGCPNDD